MAYSDDSQAFKKMMIGMALIISASATMHVFVFSKSKRAYRNLPSANASPRQMATPIEGKVVIVGSERFYLEDKSGKRWMFLLGKLQHPQVGQSLRVFYSTAGVSMFADRLEPLN